MAEDKSRAKAMEAVEAIFERYVRSGFSDLFIYLFIFYSWVSGFWVFCSERFWFWEVL
jgi:hypothetical protein